MVLLILTTSITLESPKGGVGAAGTSENEVRFGISVCAARAAAARARSAPHAPREAEYSERASALHLRDAVQSKYLRNNGL